MTETHGTYKLPKPQLNGHPSAHDSLLRRICFTGEHSILYEDIEARKRMGLEIYGVPLQPHNGRPVLVDAYQEILDLLVYLEKDYLETKDLDFLHFQGIALEIASLIKEKLTRDK